MKGDKKEKPEGEKESRKGWIRRMLDWMAGGHKKAVKSGNYCPT
jgi:hypothetical protein